MRDSYIFGDGIPLYKTTSMRYRKKPVEIEEAHYDGATEALSSQWKDPKEELPEDEERVLIYGDRGIELAAWNEHYECWDDAEGDDCMYDKDYVKLWMSIPDIPDEAE